MSATTTGAAPKRVMLISSPEDQVLRPFIKLGAQQLCERGLAASLTEGRSIDRFQLNKAKQLIFFARSDSFFSGKVNSQPLRQLLAAAGGVSGKQAYALLLKRGIFNQKALLRFMKALEAEGLLLLDSAIVDSKNTMKAQLNLWQFDA